MADLQTVAVSADGTPIATMRVIDKETGNETPVNVSTCAEAVSCSQGISMEQHLRNLYTHANNDGIHVTAEQKAAFETKEGAQEKADAAKEEAITAASLMAEAAKTAAATDATEKANAARDAAYRHTNETATNLRKFKAGLIYPLASAVIPVGFLLCDGAAYSRSDYPELFAAIGTIYGRGDGKTTFNVPNLTTRVPVGAGGKYELGATGGEEEHTLTVEEMPRHTHKVTAMRDETGSINSHGDVILYANRTTSYLGSIVSNDEGEGKPHNNMQPYTVVNYIIATGKDTAVSVYDIIHGEQAIPLGVEFGGTGATSGYDACKNIEALHATESTEYPGCYYRIVDGEQEWLNAPCIPGKEYRTSERIDNKPLYTYTQYCNLDSATKNVQLPCTSIKRMHGWTSIDAMIPNNHPQSEWRIDMFAVQGVAHITVGSSIVANGDVKGFIQVWYTKK